MSKIQKYQDNATTDSPWYFAAKAERDYLTPEDVTAAIQAGASFPMVAQAVLEAVEAKSAEDASLCAFVTLRLLKKA